LLAAISGPRLATLGLGERGPRLATLGLSGRHGGHALPNGELMQKDAISGKHSALGMFENPEVHEAATENVMRVGRGLLRPSDHHLVRAAVATGFLNISSQIQKRIPKLATDLLLMTFNDDEKNAILTSLRLTSGDRLLSIGEGVGQAMHQAGSVDRQVIRQRIEAKLLARADEIRKLRHELLPASVREALSLPSSEAHSWELTLDPENVHVMGAYIGGKFAALTSSDSVPGAGSVSDVPLAKKRYGILGGVLEEGRALLDILKSSARLEGNDLVVPAWVTQLGGNMDVSSQDLNCEHKSGSDSKITFMKALLCPLKFGTQGMDALRSFHASSSDSEVLVSNV